MTSKSVDELFADNEEAVSWTMILTRNELLELHLEQAHGLPEQLIEAVMALDLDPTKSRAEIKALLKYYSTKLPIASLDEGFSNPSLDYFEPMKFWKTKENDGLFNIYEAKAKILDNYYTIKSIAVKHNASLIKMEDECLKKLQGHNNIVRYYGYLEDDTHYYMVFELYQKSLLNATYDTIDSVAQVFAPIVDALAFCESKGVVHRKVHRKNVLYTGGDSPRIVLANFYTNDKVLEDGQNEMFRIAPEQLKRHFENCACFGLGVLLYELMYGDVGPSGALLTKERHDEDVDKKFAPANDLSHRLMSKEPDERFSMSDVLREFDWVAKTLEQGGIDE